MTGPKKPRASISVTLLEDADFVALMSSGDAGLKAVALFMLLVVKAKALGNGGVFRQPIPVVAAMLRTSPESLCSAIDDIGKACGMNRSSPWIHVSAGGDIVIPRFNKWNADHGGQREGAGRPPDSDRSGKVESSPNDGCNQDDSREPLDSILIPPLYVETERNVTERIAPERNGVLARSAKSADEKPVRHPDPIWDTVVSRWYGGGTVMTKNQRGMANAAVRDLKLLGATPDEIEARAARLSDSWGESACTINSLVKHWHQFAAEQRPAKSDAEKRRDLSDREFMETLQTALTADRNLMLPSAPPMLQGDFR
jgi:hypothetical protein